MRRKMGGATKPECLAAKSKALWNYWPLKFASMERPVGLPPREQFIKQYLGKH